MCRCAERRSIITQAVGGTLPAGQATALIKDTIAQDLRDAGDALRNRINLVKTRLAR